MPKEMGGRSPFAVSTRESQSRCTSTRVLGNRLHFDGGDQADDIRYFMDRVAAILLHCGSSHELEGTTACMSCQSADGTELLEGCRIHVPKDVLDMSFDGSCLRCVEAGLVCSFLDIGIIISLLPAYYFLTLRRFRTLSYGV